MITASESRTWLLVAALCLVGLTGGVWAQTTSYIGPDDGWNNDNWNSGGNWDSGIPNGTIEAVIPAGKLPSVDGDGSPAYDGSVTLQDSAKLWIVNVGDLNALGTNVVLQTGARLILVGDNYTVPVPIQLTGDAEMKLSESTGGHHTKKTYIKRITGAYSLTLYTGNNNTYDFQEGNSFDGLTLNAGNSRVDANAAGCLGVGDVTMNSSATLRVYASGAMDRKAVLSLNGGRDTKLSTSYQKLHMVADNTVRLLYIDGVEQVAGTYGRIGHGGVDFEVGWMSADGVLTVLEPILGMVLVLQ